MLTRTSARCTATGGTFASQFINLTAEETVAVLDELAIRTGVPRDKVEQVAFRAFSIADRIYRLARHNLAEIQDIREEATLALGCSMRLRRSSFKLN